MYTILYAKHTKFSHYVYNFVHSTNISFKNVSNSVNSIYTISYISCIHLFKECAQFYILFKVHNFLDCTQFYTFKVHKFSANVNNFVYLLYTIF